MEYIHDQVNQFSKTSGKIEDCFIWSCIESQYSLSGRSTVGGKNEKKIFFALVAVCFFVNFMEQAND